MFTIQFCADGLRQPAKYPNRVLVLLMGMTLGCLAYAAEPVAAWPADAMVDANVPRKTLAPRVKVDSGILEWVPHVEDLTPWVTLSPFETRATPRPQIVKLLPPLNGDPQRGKVIAMDTKRGNCVTCHEVPGEDWPGTLGPALDHYKRLQRTDADLYQQIYDVRVHTPRASMPPFGTMGILQEQDIRDLVAYLQSLE